MELPLYFVSRFRTAIQKLMNWVLYYFPLDFEFIRKMEGMVFKPMYHGRNVWFVLSTCNNLRTMMYGVICWHNRFRHWLLLVFQIVNYMIYLYRYQFFYFHSYSLTVCKIIDDKNNIDVLYGVIFDIPLHHAVGLISCNHTSHSIYAILIAF